MKNKALVETGALLPNYRVPINMKNPGFFLRCLLLLFKHFNDVIFLGYYIFLFF